MYSILPETNLIFGIYSQIMETYVVDVTMTPGWSSYSRNNWPHYNEEVQVLIKLISRHML